MKCMKKIPLKGGSLSSTNLIIENKKKFVRKEISLKKNREYGYQRWYTQLKRIQRYNKIFPNLFPKLLNYGLLNNNTAFFDIQYIENSLSGYDFLLKERNKKKINKFFIKLIDCMNIMHSIKFTGSSSSINLYLEEEVDKKIKDCKEGGLLNKNISVNFFNIKGKKIPNIIKNIKLYKKIFLFNYAEKEECFTHGNITLENIVYNYQNNKLFFIDPYDENVIDSELAEYSQILQSSNAKYEYLNNNIFIKVGDMDNSNTNLFGLNYFHMLFDKFLQNTLSQNKIKIVKLFEISQFIRMLPFKLRINKNLMVKFTKVASLLFQEYVEKYE